MITCTALPLAELAIYAPLRRRIRDELTKPGSDFHKAVETKTDGHIAIVWADEVAVGWARTEYWSAGGDGAGGVVMYDTLEAFVRPEHRLHGIAALAASALYSSALYEDGGTVAVFAPHMLLVARRAGLFPVLFERDGHGGWKRV
jgi:GNAT superfamily N-acetyltransferase